MTPRDTTLIRPFASLAAVALSMWAAAVAAPVRGASAQVAVEAGASGHAEGHFMLQLAPGVAVGANARGDATLRWAVQPRLAIDSARALKAAGVRRLVSPWIAPPRDQATARALGLDRWYRAELAPGHDPVAAANRVRALGAAVARADLDAEGGLAEIPNDPSFGLQYALRNTGQVVVGVPGVVGADVGAAAAWDIAHGSDLVIAVLDSGIDPHVELAGRILPGINVPDGTTVTTDECNHGTHVAGILAAAGGNGTGIAGIAWNARLLPVVVVNGCSGFEANVASGLIWAVDNGARIANMSLQFYAFNPVFQQAVQYAHAQGALLVAATGNNGNTNIAAPARWPETIAVAATDNRDERASFSNFGPEVDIAAPGVSVYSLSGAAGYLYKNGTSMSAPHVSGAAALIWARNPGLTRDEVRALLVAGAKDLGDAGPDQLYGAGRLDIAASLALTPPPARPEDLNGDGAVNAQDIAILLGAWGTCLDCDACPADLNGDCAVGAPDIAALLSAW